jgi:hypothetical protein
MYSTNCDQCPTTSDASLNGHLECLQYLHRVMNNQLTSKDTLNAIKRGGKASTLKYLLANGAPLNEWTPCYAIESQISLECFKLLDGHGLDICCYVGNAAQSGRADILEYLLELAKNRNNDYVSGFDWEIVNETILNGHTDCLKLLIENGSNCDDEQLNNAAWKGHTEILKYLKSKNYTFSPDTIRASIISENKECFNYVIETLFKEDKEVKVNEELLVFLHTKGIDFIDVDTNLNWRQLLFNKDLTSYPNLKEKVEKITKTISTTKDILSTNNVISNDVVNYVVSKYI